MKIETILAAVDFSDITAEVVRHAAQMAAAFGSRVILLHVSEPDPDFVGYEPGPTAIRATVARDFRKEHHQLEELKQGLTAQNIPALAFHIQGALAEKILHEARTHAADLLIIGSHGHGAIYQLLVGSVAASILKAAPCPVLVIPATHHPEPPESLTA